MAEAGGVAAGTPVALPVGGVVVAGWVVPLVGASPLATDLDLARRAEDAGAAALVMHSLFEEQLLLERATHAAVSSHADSFAEAGSYLHPAFLLHVLLFGVLPAWLISRIALQRVSRLRLLAALVLALVVGAGWLYANAQSRVVSLVTVIRRPSRS